MKKILYVSNSSKLCTGFGRHTKTVLSELWKSGYEVVELSCGNKFSDPKLKDLPWKAYGTIPDDEREILNIRDNPQQIEAMFNGNIVIDRIIKSEKPDAIILVEDIWKIQWSFFKPWFNKIPTLIHTPIDSSPVISSIRDNKEILKNIWVKSDFAVRDLKEIGIDSKSIPLLTDQSFFKPLAVEEVKNLRKIFSIEDCFVIGFVFRNQLRKLVISLMRGFKEFKDKYPDSNAKLLLHTNFDEGGQGWDIPLAAENLGIDKQDILCTYICRECKSVQILPYIGKGGINCGKCGAKDSLRNPSIQAGVTDEELNAIYNMMDFYCHPATSGGFEGPMSESSLAGIPSATCDYAFGETFVRQGFSLPIECTIVDEANSGFMKSQPIDGAVCKVIEEVYNNREKYRDIGLKSRDWALEKFDLQKGISEYRDWIDNSNCEFDYSTDFFDMKNVDYPPNYSIESNKEFIVDLYAGIFGITLSGKNPDIEKYCKELIYKTREQVVNYLKTMAAEINHRQKRPTAKDFIDRNTPQTEISSEDLPKNKKKKLALICRGDEIDCFSMLPLISGIKKKYPEYNLYISTKPEHSIIFDHLDGDTEIENFVPYHPMMDDICSVEGRKGWDGLFDLAFLMPDHEHHNGNTLK